ncbi:MAG: ATP-binding cassette domain-containing protein, partial [Kiritimatiellia bacterium]|nr:ATP-binding cassette domain-containing protein [Kiritimatiellia bacterium]
MSDGDPILSLRGAGRTFATGGRSVEALHDISLDLFAGRLTVLQGPSGSGKTTLLHLAALLDSPDRGSVTFLGHTLAPGDARQAAAWRRRSIGMVFQRFYLLPHRTALQNVRFRFRYLDRSISVTRRRAQEALDSVGLTSVADTPARCLSGGEMQRVALARALAEPPHLLLADEPTGNLDPESAAQVIRLLCACRDRGIAVVVATHHPGWMEHADEAYRIEGGRLTALPPMA